MRDVKSAENPDRLLSAVQEVVMASRLTNIEMWFKKKAMKFSRLDKILAESEKRLELLMQKWLKRAKWYRRQTLLFSRGKFYAFSLVYIPSFTCLRKSAMLLTLTFDSLLPIER